MELFGYIAAAVSAIVNVGTVIAVYVKITNRLVGVEVHIQHLLKLLDR